MNYQGDKLRLFAFPFFDKGEDGHMIMSFVISLVSDKDRRMSPRHYYFIVY